MVPSLLALPCLIRERLKTRGIAETLDRQHAEVDEARELLVHSRADHVFACGSGGMLDALADLALATRVPAGLSREAYLRCWISASGSCAHGDRLVCLNGPVFDVGGVRRAARPTMGRLTEPVRREGQIRNVGSVSFRAKVRQ
jgi:hypothetical protein